MSRVLNEYKPEETILFPQKIRFHPELTFGEKVFLAEIESMSSHGKYLTLSSRSLSELFGVSHQTINNWVKKLLKMGFIEVQCDYLSSEKNKLLLKTKSKRCVK